MRAVSTLDLRPDDRDVPAGPLANIEAEQCLLGILLYDNAAFNSATVAADQFYEPTHQRTFAAISTLIAENLAADAVTVAHRMGVDAGLAELGGVHYLGDLMDRAPPAAGAPAYAGIVAEMAHRRALVALGQALVQRAADPSAGAVDELLGDLSAVGAAIASTAADADAGVMSAAQAADEVFNYLDAADDHGVGVLTGFTGLDDRLGPLVDGDLILLTGRSGMMKSALGGGIAQNIARTGRGFVQVNLEMSVAQMTRRHLTNIAHERFGDRAPAYKEVKRKAITYDQRRILETVRPEFAALPLKMVRRSALTLSGLRRVVLRQRALWAAQGISLGAVSVDHVGLLSTGETLRRYEEQTKVAMGLKQLAGELGCPILGLVQLNRDVEKRDNRRPQLFDLKDTGAWEENADAVIGIYREAYYALKEPEPKDGKIGDVLKWDDWDRRRKSRALDAICMKVREGEEGTVTLWCDPARDAVRDREPELWI